MRLRAGRRRVSFDPAEVHYEQPDLKRDQGISLCVPAPGNPQGIADNEHPKSPPPAMLMFGSDQPGSDERRDHRRPLQRINADPLSHDRQLFAKSLRICLFNRKWIPRWHFPFHSVPRPQGWRQSHASGSHRGVARRRQTPDAGCDGGGWCQGARRRWSD